MKLYYFPLSTYSQKALIAFYEKGVPFTPELVNLSTPEGRAAYEKIYPFGKIPLLLLDNGWYIPESSIIVEYLEDHHPSGTRLIPEDKDLARRARFHDRQFDLYVNNPFQTIFFDAFKREADREPKRVAAAKETLDKAYKFLDGQLAGKEWVLGDHFTLADASLAPSLFYLQQTYPFDAYPNIKAYWTRVSARPSFARVLKEAAPYLERALGELKAQSTKAA